MVQVRKRHKPLYKKFLKLRVNPLNNNKFLKLKVKLEKQLKVTRTKNKTLKNLVTTKKFVQVEKFKKQKWIQFLNFLKKKTNFTKG